MIPWLVLSILGSEPLAFGGGACGKLDGGVSLPCAGPNFEAYSALGCVLGRTFLHPLLREVILEAYASLGKELPARRWQFGESGRAEGGELWPHKTHQNGLAVDFFMPLRDAAAQPILLDTSLWTLFGYGVDIDRHGQLGTSRVDFEAIAAHLLALEVAGRHHGVSLKRIILWPPLRQILLREVPRAERFAPFITTSESWVQHDEHYHIDFELPRELRRPLSCR